MAEGLRDGTTASGCIRVTATGAFSRNDRVGIGRDGCFDRSALSHGVNPMDREATDADLRSCESIAGHSQRVPKDMDDRPKGGRIRCLARNVRLRGTAPRRTVCRL